MIRNWEEAIKNNYKLPFGDVISVRNGKSLCYVQEEGDYVFSRTEKIFSEFFDFILEQQFIRKITGKIPQKWVDYCIKNIGDDAYLCPRWTFPFCYFGKEFASCFCDTVGLDIGCITLPYSAKTFFDSFIDVNCKEYQLDYEIFIPHYSYYRSFGCNIHGIDIRSQSFHSLNEEFGDIRMLDAADSVIDFFTIAMILGPGNPACTYLDMALCLGELKRTCDRDGLIYIADFKVQPSLIVCAIKAGFRIFANNSYEKKIPIGLFLIKNDAEIKKSNFRPILEYLLEYELSFSDGLDHRILNRELLRKNSPPPKVEPIVSN
jgi:hypothetical protein